MPSSGRTRTLRTQGPDGERPWRRELFRQKLLVTEQHAGLEHLKGGVWHPLCRKWATERKNLPMVDVMAVGGWKDAATLLTCYQYTDELDAERYRATDVECLR